jgi:hypothetical protein
VNINSRDASGATTSVCSNNSASGKKTPGVPGLDLPGLNTVPTAVSYGVDA